MGMDINFRRLQQADSGAQAEKGRAPREPDSASTKKFERVMERDSEQGSGRGGEGKFGESTAPSPSSLMESLFGARLGGMREAPVGSVRPSSSASGDVGELVDALVERILVSEPARGNPEIRITLGDGVLAGTELNLTRATDGQLLVRLACADAAAFQTAVGAQDSLRTALEHVGENARVEVTRGDAEGGNEGDSRRRSRGLEELNGEA